jgi:tRNA(Ile)-lysidine synthase
MTWQDSLFDSGRLLAELRALPPAGCYWVGFSGGADSSALLDAMAALRTEIDAEVRAIHVNHGLHEKALEWEQHCAQFCARLDLDLHTERITVQQTQGQGLEAMARQLRYGVVESVLGEGQVFLTAHHREDQAETVLLNLMRSSGVDGLAGMPRTRPLGAGLLARPLLGFPMQSLRDYLQSRDIAWLEDPSNSELVQDRNFLRHQVVPLLESRWPDVTGRLARSAAYCRQASQALAQVADQRLTACAVHPQVMSLSALLDEDVGFGLLLRNWLKRNGAPPLPASRLEELHSQLREASPDGRVSCSWSDWYIRRHNDCLWLGRESVETMPEQGPWNASGALDLGPVAGRLEICGTPDPPPGQLHVRYRAGGEKIQTGASGQHRLVKDLLRERGVPPWLRTAVPLLYDEQKLLAVADLALDRGFRAWLDQRDAQLRWLPGDPLLDFVRQQARKETVDRA